MLAVDQDRVVSPRSLPINRINRESVVKGIATTAVKGWKDFLQRERGRRRCRSVAPEGECC
jgi:hypothetical protein